MNSMYNGILNVYKEAGFTSHDVVAKLRGILKQKKIGHTGTLDPDAVGVLPVCLGVGTKLCEFLTDKTKEYVAVLQLGVKTDTQDLSGRVLETHPVDVTEEQIREAATAFIGEIQQVPPMYSALKVDGRRLYELAREGKEVEIKARPVVIYEIEIQEINLPYVTMRVKCGKGTYIRTLCQDMGEKLGCLGAMKQLTRTRSGDFTIDQALTLSKIEQLRDAGEIGEHIVPVDQVFADYPAVRVLSQFRKMIDNGNSFTEQHCETREEIPDGAEVRVYRDDDLFCGIYQRDGELYKPVKMFLSTSM